jgi:hypothetical protein
MRMIFPSCSAHGALARNGTRPVNFQRRLKQTMKNSTVILIGTVIGVCVSSSGHCGENLVVNGSFEINGQGICNVNCHGGEMVGWEASGWCSVDWVRLETCEPFCTPEFSPPEGTCFVDLSGSISTPGWIRQSLPLVPGRSYRLSFDFGGNCAGDSPVKNMQVTIGPVSELFTFTCETSCGTFGSRHEIEFAATSSANILTFRSLDNPNYGPMIDDVQLFEVETCPSDIDQNGRTDGIDLAIILGRWGTNPKDYPRADTNDDGTVDATDLSVVLAGWGKCP